MVARRAIIHCCMQPDPGFDQFMLQRCQQVESPGSHRHLMSPRTGSLSSMRDDDEPIFDEASDEVEDFDEVDEPEDEDFDEVEEPEDEDLDEGGESEDEASDEVEDFDEVSDEVEEPPQKKRKPPERARNNARPANPEATSLSSKWAIDRLNDREKQFSFVAAGASAIFGVMIYFIETGNRNFRLSKGQLTPQTTLLIGLIAAGLLLIATLVGRRAPVGFVALFTGAAYSGSTFVLAIPFWVLAFWLIYRSYKIQRQAAAELRATAPPRPRSGGSRNAAAGRSASGRSSPKGKGKAGKDAGPRRPEANKRYTPKRPPPKDDRSARGSRRTSTAKGRTSTTKD